MFWWKILKCKNFTWYFSNIYFVSRIISNCVFEQDFKNKTWIWHGQNKAIKFTKKDSYRIKIITIDELEESESGEANKNDDKEQEGGKGRDQVKEED